MQEINNIIDCLSFLIHTPQPNVTEHALIGVRVYVVVNVVMIIGCWSFGEIEPLFP